MNIISRTTALNNFRQFFSSSNVSQESQVVEASEKPEIVFVLGGPGSGKGTQCKRLANESAGVHHISSGDLVRETIKAGGQVAQRLQGYIERGELLSDGEILKMVKAEIQKHPEVKTFLIDGYPRTEDQVELFEREIYPCDRVLFFDTSYAVMKSRLLNRNEGRADDNEKTIEKRLTSYKKLTLPLVNSYKSDARFKWVDASQSVDRVAHDVMLSMSKKSEQDVRLTDFLWKYWSCGNFYDAVRELEAEHKTSEFRITVPFGTAFRIVQNRADVKLALKENAVAGHVNRIFDIACGHPLNINATDAFKDKSTTIKNPIWQNIHKGLSKSLGDRKYVTSLIDKHLPTMFKDQQFDLDSVFEKTMLSFWTEYLFGPKVDPKEFTKTRELLLKTLRYTFYDSRIKTIPVIGYYACRLYRYMKQDEVDQIDKELESYIAKSIESKSGLFYNFREYLKAAKDFPQNKVDDAVLDNTFDFVLIFDFIHNVMYENLVSVAKQSLDTTNERESEYLSSVRKAFLFPFRIRVPGSSLKLNNGSIVSAGTPLVINLVKAGLYHSYGPRTCIGSGVTKWIKQAIWKYLDERTLRVISTTVPEERLKISNRFDMPISPERYRVAWNFKRDYLQKTLRHYPFKGVEKFYDVMNIYERPELREYITQVFVNTIGVVDPKEWVIVSPEVRGIPVAAVVADRLHLPLVIIRKQGKIPGKTKKAEYSTAYSKDVIELSCNSDLKDKHVVLLDDGIATGGTTVACCKLIKEAGGKIDRIMAVINHTYKKRDSRVNSGLVTTLFDFK